MTSDKFVVIRCTEKNRNAAIVMSAAINAIGVGKVRFFSKRNRLNAPVRTLIKYQIKTAKTSGSRIFFPIART